MHVCRNNILVYVSKVSWSIIVIIIILPYFYLFLTYTVCDSKDYRIMSKIVLSNQKFLTVLSKFF